MTPTVTTLLEDLNHPDYNVRSRAALTLGERGDMRALAVLLARLHTEPDFYVREDITWALTQYGDAALEPLLALLRHEEAHVRHHAAHALGKLGNARAVDGLIAALRDEEPIVLAKAAFALGQIGDTRALPALVHLLGHAHHEVHASVTAVLQGYGVAALPALARALEDERWQAREHAVDVLGQIEDEGAVSALLTALRDPHWQVRFTAGAALGQLGGASAQHGLQALENDPDSRVRQLAATLLS